MPPAEARGARSLHLRSALESSKASTITSPSVGQRSAPMCAGGATSTPFASYRWRWCGSGWSWCGALSYWAADLPAHEPNRQPAWSTASTPAPPVARRPHSARIRSGGLRSLAERRLHDGAGRRHLSSDDRHAVVHLARSQLRRPPRAASRPTPGCCSAARANEQSNVRSTRTWPRRSPSGRARDPAPQDR